ncbi:hypothetical protein D0Z07_0178 [Hyphodiscus hymeniophilus]|uniref:Uncharacterized protein n=1 Tax=Hyphodiscus hymeniophilus TaxID=353542 RepID=A0A9P6VS33_9HELO|nr:hypothetical protein D0Z07_0178 [Hyphodiscus hymeniophilus]
MRLLGSAMPMGYSERKPAHSLDGVNEPEDNISSPLADLTFDISSFTGPMTEADLREANQQEAAGILTGGLGAGLKPDVTFTSRDLLASTPISPQTPSMPRFPLSPVSLTRRMTRRISGRSLGLAGQPSLRDLGQIEANKRGEIIEVIIEEERTKQPDLSDPPKQSKELSSGEEPAIDISSFTGGTSSRQVDFDLLKASKNTQGMMQSSNVEVFYPQANWKPFSMRWPYLSALIIISLALAAAQEYLYRRGALYKFNAPSELRTWDYFSFKYLPTLVAVSFGILWQITDFEVKRLEAYYQLSKDGGALAAESINVDYITFFNFLRPFRALKFKHYAVAYSSIATLMAVSLVPTLQAASVELFPDRNVRLQDPLGLKKVVINSAFSRLLSSVLVIIAFFGCILTWQLERRRSGLVADVKGIAGIAAMANRSHILMDFKNMDTATPEMIHQTLKLHRYTLRNSSLAEDDKILVTQEEKDKYDTISHHENPHPLMLRLVAGVPFIISMLLFMIIVPVILFAPNASIVTEKAPWLLTGLAVCIKLAWGTLETDMRMIEPFYILSKRHASPKVLTLDYTAMAFGWMPIQAFLNGHVLVGLVGFGSVLAEVLTVCATSFGNVSGSDFATKPPHIRGDPQAPSDPGTDVDAGEETYASFWVSFVLALTILSLLCLVAGLVYARRRHPFLPRQPNTIASILAFIHQSKMLYDFVGTEKMNNDEMVKRLVGTGKMYGLGWFVGRDGAMHCGVDEEELTSSYKHGDDQRKATMPWTTNWETY